MILHVRPPSLLRENNLVASEEPVRTASRRPIRAGGGQSGGRPKTPTELIRAPPMPPNDLCLIIYIAGSAALAFTIPVFMGWPKLRRGFGEQLHDQ